MLSRARICRWTGQVVCDDACRSVGQVEAVEGGQDGAGGGPGGAAFGQDAGRGCRSEGGA